MKNHLLTAVLILVSSCTFGQSWKQLANDLSVNFYAVCTAAEAHFDTIDISVKGSGYKGFQRWKNQNEYKYYPSGDRSQVDPYFVKNEFDQFSQNNATMKPIFQAGWEEEGPVTFGQMGESNTFGLGRLDAVYVDPSDPQIIYISSKSGGFWKTNDGGTTWSGGSTDFLPACGVSSISVSPTNSDSILINVHNSTNFTTYGLYRSVDGGDSWFQSNFNPTNLGWGGLGTNSEIYTVNYHPTIPNLILIGTSEGIYRSSDNLATWTISVANELFEDIEFHPTNPNIVYAYARSTPDLIYVSTDAGQTFTTTTVPSFSYTGNPLEVSPACPSCVYYFTYPGVFKSIDNGATFSLVANVNMGPISLAVNDLDATKMMAGGVDGYMSNDGGLTFNKTTEWDLNSTNGAGNGPQISYLTSTDFIHADIRAIECLNGVYYAATDGFLAKSSDDGITWEVLSDTIGIRMNYHLGVSQSNHERTVCGSQDNGSSLDLGNSWIEVFGGDGMEGIIHPLNDDYVVVSAQNAYIKRSADGGISTNGGGYLSNSEFDAPLVLDPNEQMRMYSMGASVAVSETFGTNWVSVGSPTFTNSINCATIAENNSNIIIASSGEFIELSDDAGVTWTDIQGTLPSSFLTDIEFDPNDDSTIVVTYGKYENDNAKVFITHDLGSTWTNITYNLGNLPIRCVVIDFTDASTIYLGAEVGVYKKTMNETTWSLYNADLPNTTVEELEIMWGSNTLRAATWGRGLWEFSLDGREDYPAITKTDINDNPTVDLPRETMEQIVTSTILYDNTITSAYVEWSLNAPTFGNVIPMTNTSGDIWVSNSPLPDPPAGTNVFFKVFAVGSAGDTSETYKYMYTVKPFEYCTAAGATTGADLHIANVNLANVNNSSGYDSYTYYDTEVVSLTSGGTYTLTLTGDAVNTATDYGAWIDFNKNTVFEPNEEVLMAIDNGTTSATVNFTVPTNAPLNDTLRLRTKIAFQFSIYADIEPCSSEFGEIEDYPVLISCGPSNVFDTVVACDSYTWINGITYTSSISGVTYTTQSSVGCNSTATLDLTIDNSPIDVGVDMVTACESYTWIDGVTYSSSTNNPMVTIQSATGCDSTVNLNLTIQNSTVGTEIVSTCNSYTWIDGNTYTSSTNAPTWTLTNSAGCDSVVTLDLTILNPTSGTEVVSECNSYTWIDGNTYTASTNMPTWTLTNAVGCDSVVTLDLTILNATNETEVVSACNSYTWIDGITYTTSTNSPTWTLTNSVGCDSLITLDLTIFTEIIEPIVNVSACESYVSPSGNYVWNTSGFYSDTLQAVTGCDSILQINLTIETIDLGVINIDNTLAASQTNAQYQWIRCLDNLEIPGATSQTFTPSFAGDYAVIISYNSCIDTSDCVTSSVGLMELLPVEELKVYPNPTDGAFNIEFSEEYEEITIEILNSLGQVISTKKYANSIKITDIIDEATGLYLIRIIVEGKGIVIPMVKN